MRVQWTMGKDYGERERDEREKRALAEGCSLLGEKDGRSDRVIVRVATKKKKSDPFETQQKT